MTRLYDDPATFTEDMVTGFVAAHPSYVRQVPGGVVRAKRPRRGKVAVVTGGGSGHYPAFCGVVGPGFADGSVIGNIFTSPSADDAYSVGRAVDRGAGVVFSFGNYAGDNMNFGLAVERLERDGIRAHNVVVTDDVASAPAAEQNKRRGVVGDFVVFKIASAAAEEGYDFDEVVRVAEHANERTRSLGVAFDGCTLPGQDHPLFEVPEGRMGLGLGIHGEPGVSERELPSASELAKILVDGVLAEAPETGSRRVTAILNGLGATKYEELFVVWGTVSRLLAEAGVEVVAPEVGELVTSLDMAGCSLTLTWLDDELERLWQAPADTPAYRKGNVEIAAADADVEDEALPELPEKVVVVAPAEGQATATTVVKALRAIADLLHDKEEELGRLDAIAGDGDHGRGMTRGSAAAIEAAEAAAAQGVGPAAVLVDAGDAWAAKAGGTSGVLWGAALRSFGDLLPDHRAALPGDLAAGAAAALAAVQRLGRAELGDKTLVDALVPFVEKLRSEVDGGASGREAWARASETATEAAAKTADLRPRTGRARPLAERSVGTPDPGATSLALALTRIGEVLAGDRKDGQK
ncbi:dihydroxyacetone kinase [Saccharopolyspora antimicrobica]|uniref:Dihydroxyacetone kinase n=1 Tax=Saccharopolyspora antimicrobica TaxID=455193 RepID=A0A1I5H3M1_9PSEU|nr:dihydroxyacetone kinase family protein [Saccharopolyspora antimicrobica]RKT90120.1 homodimeric dihydroxyacetone kinase [Saccharopolyspora antimicrobica]SFO42819.1 dihydroxyacetone kinase [Saccharopolyspora antimicrobica]